MTTAAKNKNALQPTSGFTQAGAQLVRHSMSDSCFRLSSEPYRYPRLREAATTLSARRTQKIASFFCDLGRQHSGTM